MNVLLNSGSLVAPGSVRESPNPHLHLSTSRGGEGGRTCAEASTPGGKECGLWAGRPELDRVLAVPVW